MPNTFGTFSLEIVYKCVCLFVRFTNMKTSINNNVCDGGYRPSFILLIKVTNQDFVTITYPNTKFDGTAFNNKDENWHH